MSELAVLDHGFVKLVESMGGDASIAAAARQSYQGGTKKVRSDEGLIRYLFRNNHSTPFEAVQIHLQFRIPMFVARQIVRHRLFSYNEESGRYSELRNDFYVPEVNQICYQSTTNKQGRSGPLPVVEAEAIRIAMRKHMNESFALYRELLDRGVARETARIHLPLATYTTIGMNGNLRSWLHFLLLRTDPHAQWETRQFAIAAAELIRPIAPQAFAAWDHYQRDSVTIPGKLWRRIKEMFEREDAREMLAMFEMSDTERDETHRRLGID